MKYFAGKVFAAAFCAVFVSVMSIGVRAQTNDVPKSSATSDRSLREQINFQMAPVKSRADLTAYEINTSKTQDPLNVLSDTNKKYFIDHLRFSEKGLAGFNYQVLCGLTVSQVYKILSLFGAQDYTAMIPGIKVSSQTDQMILAQPNDNSPDYRDYSCVARANCRRFIGDICTHNC